MSLVPPSSQPTLHTAAAQTDDASRSKARIPMSEIGMVNKRAQIRGTISGITVGLLSALLGRGVFKTSSNATFLTGLSAGSFGGWAASRQQLTLGLADLERSYAIRRGEGMKKPNSSRSEDPWAVEANWLDVRAGEELKFDAGVAGLYEFVDRGATTRRDH